MTIPNTNPKHKTVPKHDSSTDDKYANEISVKERAASLKHILTHYPKNPYCETCQIAKLQSAPSPDRSKRPSDGSGKDDIKEFGDAITGDHLTATNDKEGSIRPIEGLRFRC